MIVGIIWDVRICEGQIIRATLHFIITDFAGIENIGTVCR